MKYYIIAGEASGDLHGSNLIKALKKEDASAQIRCWGGDLMQKSRRRIGQTLQGHGFYGVSGGNQEYPDHLQKHQIL